MTSKRQLDREIAEALSGRRRGCARCSRGTCTSHSTRRPRPARVVLYPGDARHSWRAEMFDEDGNLRSYVSDSLRVGDASRRYVEAKVEDFWPELPTEIASAGTRPRGRYHATKVRSKKASRPTPYRIKLTPAEMDAVEFARGRYEWPDMLAAHAAEDGSVAFTESEMWQWTDDVDSDDAPFPLASPTLAAKLQRFYDSRV